MGMTSVAGDIMQLLSLTHQSNAEMPNIMKCKYISVDMSDANPTITK